MSQIVRNVLTWSFMAWQLIGRGDAYRPKGRWFDSRSSRHVETLSKSFARGCLWRFGVKPRHSISVLCRERLGVVVDLKRRYRNSLNECTVAPLEPPNRTYT